jgi:signal transduction histidine kinase
MVKPGVPENEQQRLGVLAKYNILDTLPEQEFDDLTHLASQICQAPIAAISFVDRDRQWFKSKTGFAAAQTLREHSFCAYTILGKDPFVVEDAAHDSRFAHYPTVRGNPNIRFYAGIPLIGPEGFALGALCVCDRVPRKLSPDQIEALQLLGRQTISQMRLRRTAVSLADNEKLSRSAFDALQSGIATLNQRGEIVTVNRAWEHFNQEICLLPGCGVGSTYQLSHSHHLANPSNAEPSFGSQLNRLLRGELAEIQHEFKTTEPTGDRWFSLNATRCAGEGGVHVIITQTDITDRKRLETVEIERSSMQETVKSLEQTLGVVGHELRSPLAGLRAMTDFLMDPTARQTPEWNNFLSSLGEEVVRMSDTVDTILEAARLNSGRARWNFSTVDLEALCREVMSNARMLSNSNAVSFDWKVDPAVRFITGDYGGIRRLLINLLGNSRKYTAKGKIQVQITGHTDTDANRWVELRVRDTGIGIPPEILNRLGDAYALNSGVVDERCIGGTGLGLSICKGIASAHAGRLSIESRVGTGTTVTVKLRADLKAPEGAAAEQNIPPLNHQTDLFAGVLAA